MDGLGDPPGVNFEVAGFWTGFGHENFLNDYGARSDEQPIKKTLGFFSTASEQDQQQEWARVEVPTRDLKKHSYAKFWNIEIKFFLQQAVSRFLANFTEYSVDWDVKYQTSQNKTHRHSDSAFTA